MPANDKRWRPIRPQYPSSNPGGGEYDTVVTNIYDILRQLERNKVGRGELTVTGAVSGDVLVTNDGLVFVPQQFTPGNWGVGGNLSVSGETLVAGSFAHTGTTLGVFGRTPSAEPAGFTITNGALDHTFNADVTSLDELADIVYTIILKLASLGFWDLS